MIVNLRGISGSGKSYVGHALRKMAIRECVLPVGHDLNPNKRKPRLIGYELPGGLCVLGRYEATCGGLEGVGAARERELVRVAAHGFEHVFFEGLRTSFTYGPWIALAEDLVRDQARALPFIVLVLDTPYETCIERVRERNGGQPINEVPQRTNFNALHRTQVPKLRACGALTVEYLDHTRAVEDVLAWFKQGGWEAPITVTSASA